MDNGDDREREISDLRTRLDRLSTKPDDAPSNKHDAPGNEIVDQRPRPLSDMGFLGLLIGAAVFIFLLVLLGFVVFKPPQQASITEDTSLASPNSTEPVKAPVSAPPEAQPEKSDNAISDASPEGDASASGPEDAAISEPPDTLPTYWNPVTVFLDANGKEEFHLFMSRGPEQYPLVRQWLLKDFYDIPANDGHLIKPILRLDHDKPFSSMLIEQEFDCKSKTHRVLFDGYYSDHMGKGDLEYVDSYVMKFGWRPDEQANLKYQLLACSVAFAARLQAEAAHKARLAEGFTQ